MFGSAGQGPVPEHGRLPLIFPSSEAHRGQIRQIRSRHRIERHRIYEDLGATEGRDDQQLAVFSGFVRRGAAIFGSSGFVRRGAASGRGLADARGRRFHHLARGGLLGLAGLLGAHHVWWQQQCVLGVGECLGLLVKVHATQSDAAASEHRPSEHRPSEHRPREKSKVSLREVELDHVPKIELHVWNLVVPRECLGSGAYYWHAAVLIDAAAFASIVAFLAAATMRAAKCGARASSQITAVPAAPILILQGRWWRRRRR